MTATTDFSKFGYRERKMTEKLLHAWNENGLPEGFENDDIRIVFNYDSGYVFLVNAKWQVAMMNGEELEIHYTDFETGEEGFKDELSDEAKARLNLI